MSEPFTSIDFSALEHNPWQEDVISVIIPAEPVAEGSSGSPMMSDVKKVLDEIAKLPKDDQFAEKVRDILIQHCERYFTDETKVTDYLKHLNSLLEAEGKVLANAKAAEELKKIKEEMKKIKEEMDKIKLEVIEKKKTLNWRTYRAPIIALIVALLVGVLAFTGVMINKFVKK